MEKVHWKVDGMTCANCALSVHKTLEKSGLNNVSVNPINGDVLFEDKPAQSDYKDIIKKIEGLGYKVHTNADETQHGHHGHSHQSDTGKGLMLRFWITLPFTLILMLHMIPGLHWHWLMNPWVQLSLTLPVFLIGMEYFGKSAVNSLRSGVANMNVLITLGAVAAFGYSVYGLTTTSPLDYMFFETAASIITIVFFGNYLEDLTVRKTQKEVEQLGRQQVVMANMIAYDGDHNENIFPVENIHLKVGDLILIKSGEQVPMDCKILWGDAEVNEAIITGESIPLSKSKNDDLIGGSIIANGTVKAYVTATGKDTVLNSMLQLVAKAQTEKPPVQKLADKISAVFVPAVIVIAILTFAGNLWLGDIGFKNSLIRAIAVLVVACPCALGLATPAAIAVGLGRAAKNGILYTDISRMEQFQHIQQIVFDKTGTLTTGKFSISNFSTSIDASEFKKIVYSLEKMSTHPIAKSVAESWYVKTPVRWLSVKEEKGLGVIGKDTQNNEYAIGSHKLLTGEHDKSHQLYVLKNGDLIGWIDITDDIRPEAKSVIDFCKSKGITPVMLSGDTIDKCKVVAEQLGIKEVFAGQTPQEKLEKITALNADKPTAMVGDGINDAPALAKASISISLAEASKIAIQNASVILTRNGLSSLPEAIMLGKETNFTIKTNFFWAFLYNGFAIPVAALGYLHPTMGALIMGGSDVVLAINSLWLRVKRLKI